MSMAVQIRLLTWLPTSDTSAPVQHSPGRSLASALASVLLPRYGRANDRGCCGVLIAPRLDKIRR
jgi:hypothetical protein